MLILNKSGLYCYLQYKVRMALMRVEGLYVWRGYAIQMHKRGYAILRYRKNAQQLTHAL